MPRWEEVEGYRSLKNVSWEPGDLNVLIGPNAVVAHLYGLEERHVAQIVETFHESWRPGTVADHPTLGDCGRRLAGTLKHFRAWGGWAS